MSSFTTPTGAWTTSSLTGLGSGERLSSLLTYGGKLYATTSGSRLYEASALGTAFTAKTFPTTATPQTLLGGLSVDGKPTLALGREDCGRCDDLPWLQHICGYDLHDRRDAPARPSPRLAVR